MTTVRLVEPGGTGGIYHHAVALSVALAQAGVPVVLYTAAEADDVPEHVPTVPCLWRFPRLRPPLVRRAALVLGWLVAGMPRCLACSRAGDVLHIEGRFRPGLLVPLVAGAKLRRCSVAFSPHITFSRRGRAAEELIVRWIARRADVVFAFSAFDRRRIEQWGARIVRQLPQLPAYGAAGAGAGEPDQELVARWRKRWGDARAVVLFAGYLRPDKGLDLAVRAAARWGADIKLAVVGEDEGALAGARRLASELGVAIEVDEGYHPFPDFVAAVAAADVVVCPYRRASLSGVLALATALGRPTVATDVGGSAELATVAVPPEDPEALAAAVVRLLDGAPAKRRPAPPDVVPAYLEAYAIQ